MTTFRMMETKSISIKIMKSNIKNTTMNSLKRKELKGKNLSKIRKL